MTDNEIIKALECCSTDDVKHCKGCPYDEKETSTYCVNDLIKDTLDLNNRLKAEIEKLNVELVGMRGACESYKMHYDNAQAEIKRLRNAILFTIDTEQVNEVKQDILNTVEYNIELIKSDAIEEYKEKVKAILMDKGIYPVVVKNALNEAEKEVITNDRK